MRPPQIITLGVRAVTMISLAPRIGRRFPRRRRSNAHGGLGDVLPSRPRRPEGPDERVVVEVVQPGCAVAESAHGDALGRTAAQFREIIDRHGPDAVASYGSDRVAEDVVRPPAGAPRCTLAVGWVGDAAQRKGGPEKPGVAVLIHEEALLPRRFKLGLVASQALE